MLRQNQIWKIYGTDYKEMTKRLLSEADLFARIGARKRIGIKPNLVTPSPASFGATTHPEVVAGIIEYLQEKQVRDIVIAEGSWVGDRTSEAFEYCGYRELSRRYGVPLIDTQKESWHCLDCSGMKLNISDAADRIDFLINVPVLKGHCQTKVTCALKNLKGLLPNQEKSRFHSMGLHRPIAHLNTGIRQDFIVVDHICGDLDFEEGGNPVVRNCVMAAVDPVLVDSYASYLLHYETEEIPYIGLAAELGVGSRDLDQAELVLCGGKELHVLPLNQAGGGLSEGEELPRQRKVLDVAYAVEEVDSCSACYGSLIGALCRLEEEGLLAKLSVPIGIGQGMQGRRGKLGVGRCTKDFDHCIMGCPPEEEKIYRELKAFISTAGQ